MSVSNQLPSMTALLGLLAVAGFQNRDKIAEYLHQTMGGGGTGVPQGTSPSAGGQEGGLGGLLSSLGVGSQSGNLGGLLGSLAGGAAGGVLAGGLGQLIQHLQQNGLGQQTSSWISTGPNTPISPQQLEQSLGPNVLSTLASQTGLSEQELAQRLSQMLPDVVDRATPNGQLPSTT